MELSIVPLIEAAKGLTWQGVIVILACLGATCYLGRLRLVHGDKERAFWREATPEQIQARASTSATLPKPNPPPPSPVFPLVMLLVFIGCSLLPPAHGPTPFILQARGIKQVPDAGVADAQPTCSPATCKPPARCTADGCADVARPHGALAGDPPWATPRGVWDGRARFLGGGS